MTELQLILILCFLILLIVIGLMIYVFLSLRMDRRDELPPMGYQTMTVPGEAERFFPGNRVWRVRLRELGTERLHDLRLTHPMILGRLIPGYSNYNDLGVGSGSAAVSKRQCQIFEFSGGVYLQNLSQVNCTRLNRQRVDRPVLLHQGDVIQMADVYLQIVLLQNEPM